MRGPAAEAKTRRKRKSGSGAEGAVKSGGPRTGSETGTPLRIPYGNKQIAFQLGARYTAGGWYAPPGTDLGAFRERGWL